MRVGDLFNESDDPCWKDYSRVSPKTQDVMEMDKSQTPPGRDGNTDPAAGKKEYTAKLITAKKVSKDAEKILNKGWTKSLSKDQLDAIAGPRYKKKGAAEDNLKEFAPVGGDDREPNEEEILRQLASMWWLGTEQQMAKAQKTLAAMGWEIGQDESGDDDAGVFLIRPGDEHGDTYIAFNHSDLELNEAANAAQQAAIAIAKKKEPGVAEGWGQVQYFKHANEGLRAWKKQVAEDHGGVRLSRNTTTNSIVARNNKNRVVGIFDHNIKQGTILEDSNGIQVELKDGRYLNMRIVQSDNKIRDVLSYLIRNKDFKTLVNLKTIDNQDVQSLVKNLIDKAKQSQLPGQSSPAQVAPKPATQTPAKATTPAPAASPAKATAAAPAAKKAGWTLAQPTTQHYNGWADWEARGKKFANKTKQTVTASKTNRPPEQDYGDDFQAMVMRVKKLASMGPLKTVWDPEKRVYKNVPANPPKENNK